jgi:Na+-translocating ferredoxin:NAD+ oxidoreductase subunit G
MKDIIRMGIILMVICAVAAGALAYTNQVTSAIIEKRIYEETVAQLRELFPTLADFQTKTVDGRSGIVATDAAGNVVGILAEGTTQGYGGTIRFNLGVDADGKIVALTILQQSETAGLGDKIKESWYREQYYGKGLGDNFDVDNISGATVSSKAMENGVPKELQEILLRFAGDGAVPPAPSFSLDGVADGKYSGTAKGHNADITVEVTVAGGKITAITVTDHKETANRFENAVDVIDQIIEKQSVQVDAASGATVTSDAIVKAVQNALGQ